MQYTQKIHTFLKKQSSLPKMIVIYGPTGSGKSKMSIDIAKEINSEIISTDSRQIFKYMNIGTAKISEEQMQGIPHHMINILDPHTEFSLGEYKNEVEKIIQKLHQNNKIPILAGGTGLYIDALIYNFDIPKVVADKKLREKLEQEAEEFGADFVYQKLVDIDPEYAQEIHPNNTQYVIRAIEVKILSGKSKGETKTEKKLKYDVLFLTPYTGDREELYSKINNRVDTMFEMGLENEIKELLSMGYNQHSFGMRSIGYSEYFRYLDGEYNFDEMKNKIKQNSRNYAKRQLTWFRKYAG